jgi:oligopeptide transport system substrate-binding protein
MKNFLALLLLVAAVSCSKAKNDANEIRLSLASEIPTIDPAGCYDTVCGPVVSNSYETLFEYEYLKRPYQLRPLLAEDMPVIEENGRKVTIKLKKNIPYHPQSFLPAGRLVTAQDIVTAFKRQAFVPTQGKGWWLFEKRIQGLDAWRENVKNDQEAFYKTPISGLETPDAHTLVIRLTQPFPQLMYSLAMTFTSPIPEEAVRHLNNDFGRFMVGTGPFVLRDFNPTQQAIFERFADYSTSTYPTQGDRYANEQGMLADAGKRLPLVDKVSMIVMKEQQTSWLNFMSGKLELLTITKDYYQAALGPDGKLLKELVDKKVQMQVAPTLIYWWLAFNMKDPIVGKNLLLRQAIAHAVDIEKFIKLFTTNAGQRANSIYPPGVPGYNPSAELPYKYDVQKAKELLAKAGFPGGKGLPELTFDVRGNSSLHRQISEFVVQELNKIGIPAKPSMNSFPVFLERSRRGELQFWHGGWVLDYPDAENILQLLASSNFPPGPNNTYYANKKVDALFEKIRISEDGPEKYKMMEDLEVEVNRDLPWVMLYYSRNYILSQGRVRNFRYSDMIFNSTKYLKITEQP